MIQNFSNQTHYLFNGEDLPKTFESEDVCLYLKIDSKNTVFRFKYRCPDNQKSYFELIGSYIQDKSIEGLTESICHNIYGLLDQKKESFNVFLLDKTLLEIRNSLSYLKGDYWQASVDSDKIICRCMKVDLDKFNRLFDEHKGHKKDLVRATNMMMGCGSCKNEFDTHFNEQTKNSQYFNGRTIEDIKTHIKEVLPKFRDYSTVELEGVELEIKYIDYPKVFITVRNSNPGELDHKLSQALTNFLCAKLGVIIEVELALI